MRVMRMPGRGIHPSYFSDAGDVLRCRCRNDLSARASVPVQKSEFLTNSRLKKIRRCFPMGRDPNPKPRRPFPRRARPPSPRTLLGPPESAVTDAPVPRRRLGWCAQSPAVAGATVCERARGRRRRAPLVSFSSDAGRRGCFLRTAPLGLQLHSTSPARIRDGARRVPALQHKPPPCLRFRSRKPRTPPRLEICRLTAAGPSPPRHGRQRRRPFHRHRRRRFRRAPVAARLLR